MIPFQRSRTIVLMYHRIASVTPDTWSLCVSPEHFAEHLQVLRNYRLVRLDRLTPGGRSLRPELTVAITFDDGYADNLHEAKPILERYDTPATFFIATGSIDSTREFWWDELERIVYQSRDPRNLIESPGQPAPQSREDVHLILYRKLQPLPHQVRQGLMDGLLRQTGLSTDARPSHRILTASELRRLADPDLFEIGAHTVTHPLLAAQSPDEQSAELDGSKRWLEDFLGHPVSSFSYPYGGRPEHYVDATVDAVRRAGFCRACTTAPRPVRRRDSPWEWGRFHVADMDGDQFQRFLES